MYYFTLTGDITVSNTHELIHFFNCKRIDDNYTDTFTIFISSVGGDIDSAIRVYDFLKSIPNKIHTIGFGQVDSSAITVYLAGDKRSALIDTRFRIHEPTYYIHEKGALLSYYEERINLFKELDKRMKVIASKETEKNVSIINKLYQDGKILNSREAKNIGIVHDIIKDLPKPGSI